MCEANQNQSLPGTAAGPSIPCGAGINVDRDKETLGYACERATATEAQTCYAKAQAIHVPAIVRDLRQRRDELLHQRARIDEKLWTLNTVLGVFEG